MVKTVYTMLGCLLISVSSFAAPTTLDCQSSNNFESNLNELEKVTEEVDECPAPTKEQISYVCSSMYDRKEAKNPSPAIGFEYQEILWEMSCAKPGADKLDAARTKIQKMWMKNRESFRCYNYPTLFSSEKNIAKFSLDTGFTTFLSESVKRYKLDMNFIDPGDKKTVLDFIQEREKEIRNSPPVDTGKADEYGRMYDLLKSNGAKHAKEL